MAERFKVVFREEYDPGRVQSLMWEPGSPLCLRAVQISRNTETSESFLQIKALNISNAMVGEVRAIATVQYPGGESESFDLVDYDADVAKGSGYTFKPIVLSRADALRADVLIKKVTFEGGSSWESNGQPFPVVPGAPLDLDSGYMATRTSCLQKFGCTDIESANYKVDERDGYWICTCGQVNYATVCAHCKISKQEAQYCENKKFLDDVAEQKKEADALADEKKQRYKEKGKRYGIIAGAVIAVLVAAGLIVPPVAKLLGFGNGSYVVVKSKYIDSDGKESVYENEVDDKGNKVKSNEIKPDNKSYSYKYDEYGIVTESGGAYPYKQSVDTVDSFGQPTKITRTFSDGDTETYEIEWYGEGRVKQVVHKDPSLNYTSTMKYNGQGEKTRRDAMFDGSWSKYVTTSRYSTDYEYERDLSGRIVSCTETDEDGEKTKKEYEYDERGNIKKVTKDGKVVSEYEYKYVASPSPYQKMLSNHFDGSPF